MSFEPFKNEEKVNLYFLSHDFFSAPDFIKRFNFQTQDFIKRIKIDERNEIRTSINVFYSMCNHLIIEKKDKIFAQQMFLEIFSIYANHLDNSAKVPDKRVRHSPNSLSVSLSFLSIKWVYIFSNLCLAFKSIFAKSL